MWPCDADVDCGWTDWNYIGPPNSLSTIGPCCPTDRRLVSSGQQAINDFPLVNPAPNPYCTSDQIIARLGGSAHLIEGTDDSETGFVDNTILGNIISVITNEINSYIGNIYDAPPLRIGTVATFRVLTVDSTGKILTIEQEQPGYYQIKPPASPTTTVVRPLSTDTIRNPDITYGSGATLTCSFTASAPFTLTALPTIAAGGANYNPWDRIGLVGGASYIPVKLNTAAIVLVCHALYQRRLNPPEVNNFDDEATQWRKDLRAIGTGEMELDATFHRNFTPGAAWVTRDRVNFTSL